MYKTVYLQFLFGSIAVLLARHANAYVQPQANNSFALEYHSYS